MGNVTRQELTRALDVLRAIGENVAGGGSFARHAVEALPALIGSDLTTLVVCDLDDGHRRVVPSGLLARREIEVFDHYFHVHPLVREHGRNPDATTKRIADLVAPSAFERTPLYNDYYRAIGIRHAMAVPLHVDRRYLVSLVLNRSGTPFADRDRDLAEIIRPHLATLYRLSTAAERASPRQPASDPCELPSRLTPREREVLDWVTAGKTNADVALILGASRRTVEKHLERIYEKLGVETRTAAAMRALRLRRSGAKG